jgi:cytoskeletal protein RodZ
MISLGETLRKAREEKGVGINDVARDTNIAQRYLAALEAEDFAQFPAEAYALGFLKNYCEYLGLDAEKLIASLKVIKIQEQPLPIKELLTRTPTSRSAKALPIIIIIALVLGGAGAGAFYAWNRGNARVETEVPVHAVANYVLEGGVLEQRFYAGDSLTIPVNGELYKFSLANLGEMVTVNTPTGSLILDLSQTVTVDVNNDGINELEISLEDYARSEPLMGAWIRFTLYGDSNIPAVAGTTATDNAAGTTASVAVPSAGAKTVFLSPAPHPFSLQAQFQGFCMFRWEILREANRQARTEQYFSRGNELTLQAQNGIRLWVSNAAAVKIQVIGGGRTQPVEIGGPGEVVVADIAWMRDEAGGWKLAVSRLEN